LRGDPAKNRSDQLVELAKEIIAHQPKEPRATQRVPREKTIKQKPNPPSWVRLR
jgi:hypothetical protein